MPAQPMVRIPSGDATPLANQLRRELRGEVLFGRADRGRYATDASIYQIMPIGIVVPRDQDDLMLALAIARSHAAPILSLIHI